MRKYHQEIEKLKRIYEKSDIGATELSERCGIHRTTIYTFFYGSNDPTEETVSKIASGLGIDFKVKVRMGRGRRVIAA